MTPPLKIAIYAGLNPAHQPGGVQYLLETLINELSRLEDGDEKYLVITSPEAPDWITQYNPGRVQIVVRPAEKSRRFTSRRLRWLRPLLMPLHRNLLHFIGAEHLAQPSTVSKSDGFFESLACDVIHFTIQTFIITSLPAVFSPHDLQHLHYPQFFTPSQIQRREEIYTTACRIARVIPVNSHWVKDDLIRQYGLHPDKIQVIPKGPFNQRHPPPTANDVQRVRQAYRLEDGYCLYPAATWPHKNHLRLLDALAYLRDEHDLRVPLVCTGSQKEYFTNAILPHLQKLNLEDQVRFLGQVPGEDIRPLYHDAAFVVSASLFEAQSTLLFEAWQEGKAITAGAITSIPDQAGDAALLFDPLSVEAMAQSLRRMVTDTTLRADLIERGHRRLQDFNWERTARAYRAVYRRAAGYPLSDEDHTLLAWDWMLQPEPPKHFRET